MQGVDGQTEDRHAQGGHLVGAVEQGIAVADLRLLRRAPKKDFPGEVLDGIKQGDVWQTLARLHPVVLAQPELVDVTVQGPAARAPLPLVPPKRVQDAAVLLS
eukprot:5298989-Alexandrium_andersonii.AAC.1